MLLVTFCYVARGWLFPDKHTFEPLAGTKTKLASSQGWEPQSDTEATLLNWSSKHCQFMTETLIAVIKAKELLNYYKVGNITQGHR